MGYQVGSTNFPEYDPTKVYDEYSGPPVVVYDMKNPLIQQQVYDMFRYMKEWIPRQQDGYDAWETFNSSINKAGIEHNRRTGIYTVREPNKVELEVPGLQEFEEFLSGYLEICNMWDFLRMTDTTHLIHFQENTVMELKGWSETPKKNWLSDYEKDDATLRREAANSIWESQSHSEERFWNILLNYFAEKYNIDYENNEILRNNIKQKCWWMKPDSKVDWDLIQTYIGWEAVLHEG